RVVEQLVVVVDAAHPRPQQEVVLREDLVPELLDRLDLGEEAMAADVEPPTVALDGPADTADDVVGLEHRDRLADFGQRVCRGESGGSGADHHDVRILRRHATSDDVGTARGATAVATHALAVMICPRDSAS